MGHYLGEMETDGVPLSMKAGRSEPRSEGTDFLREACLRRDARKLVEARLGRDATQDEITRTVRALKSAEAEVRKILDVATRLVCEVEQMALDSVLGPAAPQT